MKKLLLLPILLAATLVASEYNYEITPVVGYNLTERNIGLDNHVIMGGEFQYNGFDSFINPELSILCSNANYTTPHSKGSKIYRVALNGVYDFQQVGSIIPLLKAGIGYEDIKQSHKGNSPFMDFGIGAKIPFSDTIALKFEAIYMLNCSNSIDNNRKNSNLTLLAGLNIAFGEKAKIQAPKPSLHQKTTEIHKPTIVQKSPIIHKPIDGDDDKDGILNSKDKCPKTRPGKLVYNDGCPQSLNLNVNFPNDSAIIDPSSYERIKSYAKFLRAHSSYSTDIIGYTSNTGSTQYNKKLSKERAIAVQKMIINENVPESKVRAQGKGHLNPISSNKTIEGRATNRRIEAEITKDK